MVRDRQWVRRAVLVTVTPRADPSLADEYWKRNDDSNVTLLRGSEDNTPHLIHRSHTIGWYVVLAQSKYKYSLMLGLHGDIILL